MKVKLHCGVRIATSRIIDLNQDAVRNYEVLIKENRP